MAVTVIQKKRFQRVRASTLEREGTEELLHCSYFHTNLEAASEEACLSIEWRYVLVHRVLNKLSQFLPACSEREEIS